MWRNRAVIAMIVEEIAGLRSPEGEPEESETTELFAGRSALVRGRRRAGLMAGLDWVAILILFLFRRQEAVFLAPGAASEALFTLVVLVVATHSGYRLAEMIALRTMERLCSDLARRDGNPG